MFVSVSRLVWRKNQGLKNAIEQMLVLIRHRNDIRHHCDKAIAWEHCSIVMDAVGEESWSRYRVLDPAQLSLPQYKAGPGEVEVFVIETRLLDVQEDQRWQPASRKFLRSLPSGRIFALALFAQLCKHHLPDETVYQTHIYKDSSCWQRSIKVTCSVLCFKSFVEAFRCKLHIGTHFSTSSKC